MLSTYNGERFLRKQLDSLVNQSLRDNIHLYVRDDGSKDDTLRILEEYKDKISLTIIKGVNIGSAMSFWEMFTKVDIIADYYAFCDQDDIWDSDKIEKGIRFLQGNESIPCLWCSNCRLIDANDVIIKEKMNKKGLKLELCSQFVCGTTQGCAMLCNDALRRYIISKKVDRFPMHDFVLMTYALAKGKVIYDDVPSFSYRIHTGNVVARGGKTVISRLKISFDAWFSYKHKNQLSDYAAKFLKDNENHLDRDTAKYLYMLANIRFSLKNRLKIVLDSRTTAANRWAVKSYR